MQSIGLYNTSFSHGSTSTYRSLQLMFSNSELVSIDQDSLSRGNEMGHRGICSISRAKGILSCELRTRNTHIDNVLGISMTPGDRVSR